MSFKDCINLAVKDGRLKQDRADTANEQYDKEFAQQLRDGLNEFDAADKAASKSVEFLTKQTGHQKYVKMRQMQAAHGLVTAMDKSKLSPGEKAFATIEGGSGWRGADVVSRYQTRIGQYHGILNDLMDQFRPKYAGIYKPVKSFENVVRELAGESTNDATAKELATIIRKANEKIIEYANSAGANINKNARWWMPQQHSRLALRKQGRGAWVNEHLDWLDWEHMTWPDGSEILPEQRMRYLDESFNTLLTDGLNKIIPGVKNENIASRLSHERQLYYKDAQSWLAANKKYGQSNPFDQYVGWIDQMARNTALMDVFGPNPTAMKSYISQVLKNEAAELDIASPKITGKTEVGKVQKAMTRFDEEWNSYMTGNRATDEDLFATTMGTIRNFISSALLSGSAPVAITGDLFNAQRVALLNKLPAVKFLDKYMKTTAKSMTRQEAIRSGLIAESAVSRMMSSQRAFGMNEGARWSKYVNDVTLRATLMTPHTQNAKWAYGMTIMGAMADNAGNDFDKLPFKDMLARHDITAADWDILRKTTAIHDPGGAQLLRPNDLRDAAGVPKEKAEALADKFMDMVFYERRQAIIESSYRSRSFLVGDSAGGTVPGEILRSFAMFKSFPATITMALMQELAIKQTVAGKMGHIASFSTVMMVYGALTLQMQQQANSKDPLDMSEGKFWMAAAIKGGSLGFLGDFVYSNVNEYGKGLEGMIAGAPASFLSDVRNLTLGNLAELAAGEDTKFMKELIAFSSAYTPGTKFWAWKTYYQRNVTDQLQKWADPNAYDSFRAKEQRAQRDFNQEYWWRPGETEPSRGPDFSKAWQTTEE